MTRVAIRMAMLLLCALAQCAQAATSVERFTPQHTVKQVRQVTARFSAPMVAFGDLRLAAPFGVDCPEQGSGRWVDERTWSYDFERDLPAGVRCSFHLRDGLRDLAGAAVEGARDFSFDTGGPAVLMTLPYEGSRQIDEEQIFILGLDAPAQRDSIEQHVFCEAYGLDEKIGVRIVEGDERAQLLAARKDFLDRFVRVYFKARGIPFESTFKLTDQRLQQLPVVLLQCRRSLPNQVELHLVWGAGVAAASGIATAQDQVLAYRTRPAFNATFSCRRANADAPCIPILPMRLAFSAPVARTAAAAVVLRGADGSVYKPQFSEEEQKADTVDSVTWPGPFPDDSRFTVEIPDPLRDDAGRRLINRAGFPLPVATGENPPLAKFPARFGILELHADPVLPVTLRNLEPELQTRIAALPDTPVPGSLLRVEDQDRAVLDWLDRLDEAASSWDRLRNQSVYPGTRSVFAEAAPTRSFTLPKPNGAKAFEVVGIPLRQAGFYVVELASPKLGAALTPDKTPLYVQTAALVTNLAAHFKHGAESSLVWVTTLDKGAPQPDADVIVRDCHGAQLWQGKTDAQGVAHIAQALPEQRQCGRRADYFVSARHAGDFTFTLSSWNDGIQPWRFDLPTSYNHDNLIADTVFDRTLLMAGDTLHMKHFLRRHIEAGIALPEPGTLPDKLVIRHEGSGQKYELPLQWHDNATAESEWRVPAAAKQGFYAVEFGGREAGRFRVEEFRVPTMKALLQGPREPAVQPSSVDLDIQLNYLAGGAASNAPVKLRTLLESKNVSFADYPGFSFVNGALKPGAVEPTPEFDSDAGMFYGDADGGGQSPVRTQALTLDEHGAARVAVDQLPALEQPRTLRAELEYRDANGETLTSTARIPLWPARYLIGIKPDAWAAARDHFKFQALVLDLHGKPVAGAAVAVDFLQRDYLSHRRRLIGGFYAYEHHTEIRALGRACSGTTDRHGLLSCEVRAPAAGNLILQARTADAAGHSVAAHRDVWVAGSDDWWFRATDNDRIDVLPEQKQYEPGTTATLQVRMPFREATALVTVEREGVLDSYVQPLSGRDPVVRVPIKSHYAPNVYVSVMVVRGRVGGVQPTALVDLGKPAYKLGIAELRVGWRAHTLAVKVAADRDTYKIRERAAVTVHVRRADGSAPPAGAEVALAAVDEGLLELMPNTSWQLLDAMMQRRAIEVETATAQMEVVGKRHFGRKAVPHGGGGGKSTARQLFDALLFWRGRVPLDANGDARVEVPLNDALTRFRIVAVADAGADLFGTGDTAIRSMQDLILVSGLPALVRSGDRLHAGFTVRNTAEQPFDAVLQAGWRAAPAAANAPAQGAEHALAAQTVHIAPGAAQEVGWDLSIPEGIDALQWDVRAADKISGAADHLRIRQRVVPAVPVRTLQATLVQLDKDFTLTVRKPADALAGGGIRAAFSPKLGGDLPGVRDYMARYPYTCFEQRTSKAVALHDQSGWQALMGDLPAYLDGDGLVKYFPLMSQGDDTLTAYLLSIAGAAGYPIPDDQRRRMQGALTKFVQGRIVRYSALPTADLALRKLAALAALARGGLVRAELLDSIRIDPNLWPTSALLDWYDILSLTPALPQRDARLQEAEQILRARLNLQGTTLGFSTERSDALWWLMVSGDVNANHLLLSALDQPAWRADIGRLARGALGRQQHGHWNTTVANAWGTVAMDHFSAQFESEPVSGRSSAALGDFSAALDWRQQPDGGALLAPWPAGPAPLTLRQDGGGKPWVVVQSLAAVPLRQPLSSGYHIVKMVTPVEQKVPGRWSVGDLYRVHLQLEAQSDMTWVVVDDPIPAGAAVLGTGLGTDSALLTRGERSGGWAYPAFEERSFEAYRAYYRFVPKGRWTVEYTVRLNTPGEFQLPPTRVEAMYAPEMFGALPNAPLAVAQ